MLLFVKERHLLWCKRNVDCETGVGRREALSRPKRQTDIIGGAMRQSDILIRARRLRDILSGAGR